MRDNMGNMTGVSIQLPVKVREIARATGLTPAQVSRIFTGKSKPLLATCQLLARHLGITLDELASHLNTLKATS